MRKNEVRKLFGRFSRIILLATASLLLTPFGSYAQESLISVKNTDLEGAIQSEEIVDWIVDNLRYPQEAVDKGIQGKVLITAFVDKNLKLTDIRLCEKGEKGVRLIPFHIAEKSKKYGSKKYDKNAGKGCDLSLLEDFVVKSLQGMEGLKDTKLKERRIILPLVFSLYSGKNSKELKKALYLLDGKEISKKKLDKIDPEAIESMSVLKGDKAVERYGEKAKNGAIEIKLKK